MFRMAWLGAAVFALLPLSEPSAGSGGYGSPAGAPSVYCQEKDGRWLYPQYQSTGKQTPCGLPGPPKREPLKGYVTNRPDRCVPPLLPPEAEDALMDWAYEMDQVATDAEEAATEATYKFLGSMATALSAKMKAYAQFATSSPYERQVKTAKALKKAAEAAIPATIDYLASDPEENHRKLLDNAKRTADRMQEELEKFKAEMAADPASASGTFIGNNADLIASLLVFKKAGAPVACEATAAKTTAAAEAEAARMQLAAERLQELEARLAISHSTVLATPGKRDCFWRSLRNTVDDPSEWAWIESHFDGAPPTWGQMTELLARFFGGRVNNVRNPHAHGLGLGDPMWLEDIATDLAAHGAGAEAIVIVGYRGGGGHVFAGKVFDARAGAVFIDDQKQFWSAAHARQTVQQALGQEVSWSQVYYTKLP